MSDQDRDEAAPRVTGIGGVFFKARDPKAQQAWYQRHLGVPVGPYGSATFEWRTAEDPPQRGQTVWSAFSADTEYFAPSAAPFMINYRVADLDAMLAALRAAGCAVDDKVEDGPYGRFGWVLDPEGNKIELWEPPADPPAA